MSNIIDARRKFRGSADRLPPSDDLADRIAKGGKVALADRPVFARNLGHLASKIDPTSPLHGALSLFNEADRDTQWPKRKRLIRLPGEECPAATGKGDYEASPGHYIALARAAGVLLARKNGMGDPKNEVREAVRLLAAGSTFAPRYEPVSVSEKNIISLLDEYADAVAAKVIEATKLRELWRALRQSPFDVRPIASPEERLLLESSTLGRASLFGDPAPDAPFGQCFTTDPVYQLSWAEPVLELGVFARDWSTRMFVLPEAVAEALDVPVTRPEEIDGAGTLDAWLASEGWGPLQTDGLPSVEFTEERGFGWQEVALRSLYRAELRVAPDLEGKPKLQLAVFGHQGVGACLAYHPDYDLQAELEAALASLKFHWGAFQWIANTPDDYVWSIELPEFFRPALREDHSRRRVFGLILGNPDFDIPSPATDEVDAEDAIGWTDSGLLAPYLFEDVFTFHPKITIPTGHAVPGKARSLASAILLNLRYADDDSRIDQLLIAEAEKLAAAGLRYHEALIDDYREALGTICGPRDEAVSPPVEVE